MGFNYLFIFPPYYVSLCASKARQRLGSESVSWCLETFLCLRLPSQNGAPSLPLLSLFLSFFFFFSYLFSKTMSCFSGCLMSSAGIQKLFCGICSALKCSFDEFVGEKMASPSYYRLFNLHKERKKICLRSHGRNRRWFFHHLMFYAILCLFLQ